MNYDTGPELTTEQMTAWTTQVIQAYPREACAYIVNGTVTAVDNVSETPEQTFAVRASDRIMLGNRVTAFLHSHPYNPANGHTKYPAYWPTSADMRSYLNDDVPWGISATEGENVTQPVWLTEEYTAPLEGRFFVHGIHDCYAAVRDWYKIKLGIALKNYPRGMDWWVDAANNLYEDQFADAGFIEISEEQVQPNDCVLMRIGSRDVISHAAVVVDDLNLFHHTFSRTGETLSGLVSRSRWHRHFAKYVRYAPKR